MPMTYLLPKESAAFTQQFYVEQHKIDKRLDEERYKNGDDYDEEEEEEETEPIQNIWIIKPTSSSQGRGIFLINDLSKVKNNPTIFTSQASNISWNFLSFLEHLSNFFCHFEGNLQ